MDATQSRPHVLIVDDAQLNLTILAEALGPCYELSTAASGQEALERVATSRPDLILLDILMPRMDGYEVCARLKAQPDTREIPVIFITALDEVQDKARGFELGAVDYITKPFKIVEVQARVRTHLQIAQYKRQLEQQNRELREARARLQHQVSELEGRDQLVHAQMTVATAPAACEIILQVIQQVLGCTAAAAYLPGSSGSLMELCCQLGTAALPAAVDCAAGESIVALACRQVEPRTDASGQVAVPLRCRDRALGVLWLQDMPAVADREAALHSLWRLAGEATMVLRAARMAEKLESGDFSISALLDVG